MSYCRFGEDSDVYVYPHVDGFLCCCACRLQAIRHGGWYKDFITFSVARMLKHLRQHKKRDHKVPKHAVKRLRKELARRGKLTS
jgi:hypothetical protein